MEKDIRFIKRKDQIKNIQSIKKLLYKNASIF